MTTYETMIQQMELGAYTEVTAKTTISNLYARQQLTTEEYNDLMIRADKLSPNLAQDDYLVRLVAVEAAVKILTSQVESIKQAVEGGSTVVPDPEPGQSGAEMDPIDAVSGMKYEEGLYYRDPTNGEVYKCIKTVDGWAGLPHEAVNIYFNWARKE